MTSPLAEIVAFAAVITASAGLAALPIAFGLLVVAVGIEFTAAGRD